MTPSSGTPTARFDAVLFDFHSTLVDQGDPGDWLELAWRHALRGGTARQTLGEARFTAFASWLDRIWDRVREIDPRSERDLSSVRHREVYDALIARSPEPDLALAQALYVVMLEAWKPYDDTLPTLRALEARGLKLGLVSNVGFDVRPVLVRGGLEGFFDSVILSFEAGAVKPGAAIFHRALTELGVSPEHALMVGDSPLDDAGAAALGIRTLILPRTRGRTHGLDLVLRLVGREELTVQSQP